MKEIIDMKSEAGEPTLFHYRGDLHHVRATLRCERHPAFTRYQFYTSMGTIEVCFYREKWYLVREYYTYLSRPRPKHR